MKSPGAARPQGGGARRVEDLIAELNERSYPLRTEAARELIAIGSRAVAPLVAALAAPDSSLRWEAALILSRIADPVAASALVRALDDDDFGVRWLAAEGLAAMGRKGLEALLETLIDSADSKARREGARHVLRRLAHTPFHEIASIVLKGLDTAAPETEVPVFAFDALEKLRDGRHLADIDRLDRL